MCTTTGSDSLDFGMTAHEGIVTQKLHPERGSCGQTLSRPVYTNKIYSFINNKFIDK